MTDTGSTAPAPTEPLSTATDEEKELMKAGIDSRYNVPPANLRTPADNAAEIITVSAENKTKQVDVQKEADEAAAKLAPPPPAVTPPPQPGTEAPPVVPAP
jgi:hypothetical protein